MIFAIIIAFIFGAALGSFACCQAWRLRLKEQGKKSPGKWSICMSCKKRLKPIENIPIFSWLVQKGKCKHCGKKIGRAEILSELGLALAFSGFTAYFWPKFTGLTPADNPLPLILETLLLTITIIIMWILLTYDAKWQKLPTVLLIAVNALAAAYLIVQFIFRDVNLLSLALSLAMLPGMYFLLYAMSKERLVGSGDWLLALALALILENWELSLVALFLSNFLASIYGLIKKRKTKNSKIPFGPFLVLAFIIVFLLQSFFLSPVSISL